MALLESLIVFLVSLGIGALGIHLGAMFVQGESDYRNAIITAFIGALVWSIMGFFFGWIPLLGPILTFIAWLGVVNWRYSGGWVDAVSIALIAWISVAVILYILAVLGITTFEAVGVPGV